MPQSSKQKAEQALRQTRQAQEALARKEYQETKEQAQRTGSQSRICTACGAHCAPERLRHDWGIPVCDDCFATGNTAEDKNNNGNSGTARGQKLCPFCAEKIQATAIKCRFCGSDLSGLSTHNSMRQVSAVRRSRLFNGKVVATGVVLIVIICVVVVGIKRSDLFGRPDKNDNSTKQGQAAAVSAPLSEQRLPPPIPRLKISGEVWVQRNSGDTLALASEEIYALPLSISVVDDSDFRQAKERQEEYGELATKLPGNEFAVLKSRQAKLLLNEIQTQPDGFVSTASIVNVSASAIQIEAGSFKLNTAAFNSPALESSQRESLEFQITRESFWKCVSSHKIASATTGRTGQFNFSEMPPGHYVFACRVFNPALGAVVYWALDVDGSKGGEIRMDLTPSNAKVISY